MKNEITLRLRQLLTIFVLLAFSITSCQKEETISPEATDETSLNPLVESAIEWYSQHSKNAKDGKAKDFALSDYQPDWETAAISKNSKGVPIVNVKLVNRDEYYADSRFMELSIAVGQSGQREALIKEFLTNPYESDAKMNLYTGNGDFIISGEYNNSVSQLQKLSTMSANTSCSTNPDQGTTGSPGSGGNPGPCNDDGSDPQPGGWLEEVTITDPFPGGPDPHGPGIPSPVTNPGTPIPVQPGTPGGSAPPTKTELGANRFVMKDIDQSKYPRFTTMVKELKSFVQNDKKVMEALVKWSGFTEAEILSKIEFGKGPEIVIKDLGSSSEYGYFKGSENPNVVNINASWVRGLEAANLTSTQQATAFLLGVTLLHEFVHQARFANNLDRNYEYGLGFENSSFGIIINKDNASQYSYRMYQK
ncbi:hypothetical protein [Olivibacter domesticus]|uniref:Metallopeptidase toxin 3 n=1 Tax=Olivibacter domesticus TaxID=407022 RepID=A0A1H7JW66_OLID1|nr:hypothetical protein [Olivibacter domesticus]SEK77855.1 Metallopeptidase toxin 3 [Olivibacter domesticus]